jgi:hypothetical protein
MRRIRLGEALGSIEGTTISMAFGEAIAAATEKTALSWYFINPVPATIIGMPAYIREYPMSDSNVIDEAEIQDQASVSLQHDDWYAVLLPAPRLRQLEHVLEQLFIFSMLWALVFWCVSRRNWVC